MAYRQVDKQAGYVHVYQRRREVQSNPDELAVSEWQEALINDCRTDGGKWKQVREWAGKLR